MVWHSTTAMRHEAFLGMRMMMVVRMMMMMTIVVMLVMIMRLMMALGGLALDHQNPWQGWAGREEEEKGAEEA